MHKRPSRLIAIFLLSICATAWGSAAGHASTDTPSSHSYVDKLLNEARETYHSSQAIVVMARAPNEPHASLATYSFDGDHWKKTMGPVGAVLGKRGISLHKREGDMKSPAGVFYIGRGFGSAAKPADVKLPFTRTTQYDYWVDDPTSADYNRWETYFGDPDMQWKSYERLRIPAYEYAAVIRYNMEPTRKGRGSAIFFHIWPGPDGFTAGCTAVSKENVLKVLRWLDPAKRPVIVQGTAGQLKALAQRVR